MRFARLALFSAAVVLALAASAVAVAMRPPPVEDGTLSVRDGRATIHLRMKGGLIGRFAQGSLTLTRAPADANTIVVRGAERTRFVNARKTVYTGRNIRFRIAGDRKFTVRIHASKINFSAVGLGDGWLDGWGNPDRGVYFDGSFSLNGAAYRSLPDDRELIQLEAVPTDS
jgi:hypothetical protein